MENTFIVPAASNKTINREIVTPHKISVILLIKQQCLMKEKYDLNTSTTEDLINYNTQVRKTFCTVILKLIQTPDLDYISLKQTLCNKAPGKELSPELVEMFFDDVAWLLRDRVAALLDIVTSANKLINGGCAKYSVLGLFLRRVLLNFDKLTFSQVVELFREFENYTSSTVEAAKADEEHPGRWTRREAEHFFAREVNRLMSEDPAILQEKISRLLQYNPDFAEAHFLSFLNCVRSKELCGAKESLHQCFDRALSPSDKSSNTAAGNTVSEERSFRYGTLNLAAMHVLFGHKEEALLTLKEVIRLSHNAGDCVFLQHSLSWLYTISDENRDVLIHRAMARCSELKLGYLLSLAVQAFTKYSGQTDGRPRTVFDVLMKSDAFNSHFLSTGLPANSFGLKAALWSLYGHSSLSSLYSQQLLRRKGPLQKPICLAMCNVAKFLADQGEYQQAITILNEAQEIFPRQKAWMVSYQQIHLAHLVNQSKFWEAAESVILLAPIRPSESALRSVWLHHLTGNHVEAISGAHKILKQCNDNWFTDTGLPALRVRALVTAADCLQPGEAISFLLQALHLAQKFYLHYLGAVIAMSIANNLLCLSLGQRALRVTEFSLPYMMAHGNCQMRGRTLALLARCRLAVENLCRKEDYLETAKILTKAQDWLMKAQDYVRLKHCWYLKSLIYHEIGLLTDRNHCAFEFRQLEEIYPSSPAIFTSF